MMDRNRAPGPQRWQAALQQLQHGLLEREAAVRLALLAALAGEHVLLIGPPGTAKSELARRLHRCFADARYFERLLTRFSTPEELFGPLSLKALEDDRYERLVDGFLPTAGIAFLDEVFKANSAILNALLTLLNEREFDNGSGRQRVPLISVVAASNEVPVDEALLAFFDRFLVRVPVRAVSDEQFAALLGLSKEPAPASAPQISAEERSALAHAAGAVTLSPAVIEACTSLRHWLAEQALQISDRRWRQWIELMRMAAATEGRSEVDEIDLWLAPYVASPSPEWAPRLEAWFESEVLNAVPQAAPWLTRAVEAFEKQLEIESTAEPEGSEDAAGKLALARAIGRGESGEAMLRIVSATLEDRTRRRFSSVHVAARRAQIETVLEGIAMQRVQLIGQRDSLARRLAPRLWLPPEQVRRWLGAHDDTLDTLAALSRRLEAAREGFGLLPIDAQAEASTPPPVAWTEDAA